MAQASKAIKPHIDPMFQWQGTNKQGRRLKGEQSATSLNAVKANLRRRGITPTKVKKKPKDLFAARKPAIKPADIAVFSRMSATMMSSGVPLMQSMQIISKQSLTADRVNKQLIG